MSSTQEKLRKIYNQIGEGFYWEGTYGDDDPQVEIDRQQFVDEIMQLIDSAKREGVLTELKWAKGASVWNIESRIAQLEQSKESE